ncbi:calcium:proton antiporter [Brucella thiophenivorans]|uniref:Sodium/calcium exchanger family protein n=1 Tax=Brucella thiophenivorans TaxID=571255 RepID=A0A256FBX5_9HYPH|nr:ionic transporter [Brucella thiophenivorans]OYR12230.1 sodium/calcium exchanger family protein [Brucella thiophenivorans]
MLAVETKASKRWLRKLTSPEHIFPVSSFFFAFLLFFIKASIIETNLLSFVIIEVTATTLVLCTIFAVLHHAEVIAQRVGEPYGMLILTLAVTCIEVSIIISMMLHGENNPTLARESVFSTVMIVCSGIVGLAITLGALRHKRQELKTQGTTAFLSVLIATTGLTMILPNYTLSAGSTGTFTPIQLMFVALLSFLLYASFLIAQSKGQKDDFIQCAADEQSRAPDSDSSMPAHFIFLMTGLFGIVLLTEFVASGVENGLAYLNVPQTDAIVGALIAAVILLPEAISAIRASLNNQLQRGLNIALGSACATIGLTIPAVAIASLVVSRPLSLGLDHGDIVLILMALSMSALSFATGRTTLLTGLSHLVIFVAYLMLIVVP